MQSPHEADPGAEPDSEARTWTGSALIPTVEVVAGLVLAGAAIGSDAARALIVGAAAVILLVHGVLRLVRRPGVTAEPDLLVLRTLTGRRLVPAAEVIEARVIPARRFGLRAPLLRLEYRDPRGDERLEVWGRGDLGADPEDVAGELAAMGYSLRGARD